MTEPELRKFVTENGFTIANMSYRLTDDGLSFEYFMVIRTTKLDNMSTFAVALRKMNIVRSFRISPTGD
jgi:putative Mg2+ transporter-C (MgtC) family protein